MKHTIRFMYLFFTPGRTWPAPPPFSASSFGLLEFSWSGRKFTSANERSKPVVLWSEPSDIAADTGENPPHHFSLLAPAFQQPLSQSLSPIEAAVSESSIKDSGASGVGQTSAELRGFPGLLIAEGRLAPASRSLPELSIDRPTLTER